MQASLAAAVRMDQSFSQSPKRMRFARYYSKVIPKRLAEHNCVVIDMQEFRRLMEPLAADEYRQVIVEEFEHRAYSCGTAKAGSVTGSSIGAAPKLCSSTRPSRTVR
jgi:hypothetical protein